MVFVEVVKIDGSKGRYFGTGFFVSYNRLLTAGHIVHPDIKYKSMVIRISLPGLSKVDSEKLAKATIPSVKCNVVDKLYVPKSDLNLYLDLAILDSGNFTLPTKHLLNLNSTTPSHKSTISVIGYPHYISVPWIEEHEGLTDDGIKARNEAEALFPPGHLTLTRGVIHDSRQQTFQYNISTCPGMSGGCVLQGGKVVGEILNS